MGSCWPQPPGQEPTVTPEAVRKWLTAAKNTALDGDVNILRAGYDLLFHHSGRAESTEIYIMPTGVKQPWSRVNASCCRMDIHCQVPPKWSDRDLMYYLEAVSWYTHKLMRSNVVLRMDATRFDKLMERYRRHGSFCGTRKVVDVNMFLHRPGYLISRPLKFRHKQYV